MLQILESEQFYRKDRMKLKKSSSILVVFLIEQKEIIARRELLSIIKSIKAFHYYLYGQKFLVRTDHASLKWLLSFKDVEGQLARWMEKLQQYDFEVTYRKGKLHANADGLSRRPCASAQCRYCARVEMKKAQKQEKLVHE